MSVSDRTRQRSVRSEPFCSSVLACCSQPSMIAACSWTFFSAWCARRSFPEAWPPPPGFFGAGDEALPCGAKQLFGGVRMRTKRIELQAQSIDLALPPLVGLVAGGSELVALGVGHGKAVSMLEPGARIGQGGLGSARWRPIRKDSPSVLSSAACNEYPWRFPATRGARRHARPRLPARPPACRRFPCARSGGFSLRWGRRTMPVSSPSCFTIIAMAARPPEISPAQLGPIGLDFPRIRNGMLKILAQPFVVVLELGGLALELLKISAQRFMAVAHRRERAAGGGVIGLLLLKRGENVVERIDQPREAVLEVVERGEMMTGVDQQIPQHLVVFADARADVGEGRSLAVDGGEGGASLGCSFVCGGNASGFALPPASERRSETVPMRTSTVNKTLTPYRSKRLGAATDMEHG